MERKYDHNAAIIYVDSKGERHAAIVTSWWGAEGASYDGPVFGNPPLGAPDGYVSPTGEPGVNLVFIEDDAMRKDTYGRQISRATSVVHKSKQPAHGNFWCWPDEA